MAMTVWTVQQMIDALQSVEDKTRPVMLAGEGGRHGVELVGRHATGHIIIWDTKKWRPVQRELDAQMAEWVRESRASAHD